MKKIIQMGGDSQFCSICLMNDPYLCPITATDKNNCSIIHKLRSCVSEIEWKETYSICAPCDSHLEQVYRFREKCLYAENLRNQQTSIDCKIEVEEQTLVSNFGNTKHVLENTETLSLPDENLHNETTVNKPETTELFRYKCEYCESSFKISSQLVRHTVDEHQVDRENVRPFVCLSQKCDRKFQTSKQLSQHSAYHRKDRRYVCTVCGKSYKSNRDLNVHEKVHSNKREYKCGFCTKDFNTHKNLYTHKIVCHTDPSLWKYSCELCARKFPMKSTYVSHMRRHTNERPFACHLCDKKYLDKVTLQKHLLSHTNTRDHVCDVCHKEYREKRIMEIHKRKIHGIGDIKIPQRTRKYLCHLCPKAYYDKPKLTRHILSHTGEKPFFCHSCPKKFNDVSYLNQHMKKVHNFVRNEDF